MIIQELDDLVNRGRLGENKGVITGMPKLDDTINGIQKGTYYLFGGNTGTGKTAFVDHTFILNPYHRIISGLEDQFTIKVFYWSLEIDKLRKLSKWIAHKIWLDNREIVSLNDILSIGKHRMDDNLYNLYKEKRDYFEEMTSSSVILTDENLNPTGIYKKVKDYCVANGKFEPREIEHRGITIKVNTYVPNNPKEIVLVIIDHIGLIKGEKGYNRKEKIDKLSEYMIILRNTFGVSPIFISQFNRSLADVDRQRFKELTPQLEDFKETGNTQEDANVVATLFDPSRYNMGRYSGYNLDHRTASRFRSISILKNRDGEAPVRIGLNFMGECGWFRELPSGESMEQYHYNRMLTFEPF